jgi:hypothetical protein
LMPCITAKSSGDFMKCGSLKNSDPYVCIDLLSRLQACVHLLVCYAQRYLVLWLSLN